MSFVRLSALGAVALGSIACTPDPPPRWQEGGAPLVIPEARWEREDEIFEIAKDGRVFEDGDHVYTIDVAGRVVDEDNEPVAILLPSGQVAGPDSVGLGHVGVTNAAPPGSSTAWLAVLPNGTVVRFDMDGDRSADGQWFGCRGAAIRTCTLLSHVIAVKYYRQEPRTTVGVGIGIGF